MAFLLRLPPALDADARARCDRLGISLNALLCVALDSYLRGPEPSSEVRQAAGLVSVSTSRTNPEALPVGTAPVPERVPVREPDPVAVPVLSRAERRRLEREAKRR